MNDDHPDAIEKSKGSATLWDRLWAPCDVVSVVLFRVAFSLIVLLHIGLYFRNHSIEFYFGRPAYHLSYFGFEWVRTLDLDGMRRIYYLMAMAAIGVGLGLLYRVSAVLLFVTFTYTFLAEAAQFQNHYYLMCLVAFLLILIPAHRSFSIDAILVPDKASCWIPNWCRWLLMFQIAVPYFYGGIAKLNADWLHAVPAGLLLMAKGQLPVIGPWLTGRSAAWFFSYTGLIFELSIVPLLLWKKTRVLAFGLVVTFHLSDAVLFDADAFPWMMILVPAIFFPPDWTRKLLRLNSLPSETDINSATPARTSRQQLTIGFVTIFLVWQLLFPLRHLLYPGAPGWTGEGYQFAWRMPLRAKRAFFILYATDGPSGQMVELPMNRLVTPTQLQKLAVSPDQLVAIAPSLAEWSHEKYDFSDVEIRAFVLTSLNGRQAQLQVDPDLDLRTVDRSIWPQPGIIPLTEPRREEVWDVPVANWAKVLDIMVPVSVPVSD